MLKYRSLALGVAWRCLQPRVRLRGRGLPVVQEISREADVRQEAASLALCVRGQVVQVMEEAPGVVSVVMRDAIGWGAYRGVRKAGVGWRGRGSWGEPNVVMGRGGNVIVEGRRCRSGRW